MKPFWNISAETEDTEGYNMLKRILTSVIGLAVFFAVVFAHHYVLYCAVTLIVLGMLYEMYNVMELDRPARIPGSVSALCVCAGFIFNKQIFGFTAACMVPLIAMVFMHEKTDSKKLMTAGFAAVAIAVLMSSLFMIRKRFDKYTVLLPFVCAWLTDTGAYFTGKLIGKHKLAPKISPKKTIEGSVGGIILSCLGSVAYIYLMVEIMAKGMPEEIYLAKFAFIGIAGSVLSQFGDLAASCIKRDYGKKDYGTLLPGHGGLLDRFDSVLFAAPFVYYAMMHIVL